jgi:beta-mannosidase
LPWRPLPTPDGSVNVTVRTDALALYVTLTTLAQGRFSDNAFLMLPVPGVVALQFVPVAGVPADVAVLTSSLRVEHVATYMSAAGGNAGEVAAAGAAALRGSVTQ